MSEGPMTRRTILKSLTMLGATAAAGLAGLRWAGPAAAEEPVRVPAIDSVAAHQWFYLIDLRRCDGCGACTHACQEMHGLDKETEWIKLYEMKGEGGLPYTMVRTCQHCENAPCVKVCPVGASFKSPDGLTLVDQSTCIGCRMCMAACPYDARYFNYGDPPEQKSTSLMKPSPEYPVPQQKGTVGKCVLCVHNLRAGKLPGCLISCSMNAIFVGDFQSGLMTNGGKTYLLSEYMKENHVTRYKEEMGTRPRVYYVLGHGELI